MQISSVLRIHPRYMRSVYLERDIKDPASSLGYILTPVAQQSLERIASGFAFNSTQRSWRLAGDYGSGKTAFGLALARIARGAKSELPRDLRDYVGRATFLPVLATGDNEPLGATLLRALGVKGHPRHARPATEEVMQAVRRAVIKSRHQGHSGLLLLMDEVGKNLEHAARNPEAEDVFLLQRLAEEAARSGGNTLIVVVMLHQGIAAYTSGLDSAAKREWDKVAGRFEEIIYAQPIEQMAALVAATLSVDVHRLPEHMRRESDAGMKLALRAGLFGSAAPASLAGLGPKLFPLHPTTLPVLVRTMRRFGQNERSLFSFISSSEPMALQQHAAQPVETAGHYRIHHFFDYVRANLLPTVALGNAHTHWGVIEAILASTAVETPEEQAVLKTVAMLSLLDTPDLPATEEIVSVSVGTDRRATERAIHALRSRNVLYERGAVKGLCLWPHTSVNLDELFKKAIDAVSGKADGLSLLCKHISSALLVPRSFYAHNGTLRYAEVGLLPVSRLTDLLNNQPKLEGKGADLNLRVLLPIDKRQQHIAEQTLSERTSEIGEGLFIAVADPPNQAVSALIDLVAWKWIRDNASQLAGDRYAREEVTRQIAQAERNLKARLCGLENLAVPAGRHLAWYHKGADRPTRLAPGRELLTFLGSQCKDIYHSAPRILNELINRRSPSSAAVAARTKLVEGMATTPHKPYLGMDETKRPPEMALYLSILKDGGFHVEAESGWVFRLPSFRRDSEACNLRPSLDLITRTLKTGGTDALIPIPEIFRALSRPPYGVREGLQPFLLAIYLSTHHQQVALYEDGTYRHEVGGEVFLRLMKEPQFFHLQYCELEGIRADLFAKLLHLLKFDPRDASRSDLLDLVRPLVVFISREIPEYSRKTNNLPAAAVAVRRALLDAREPVKLVFTTLPEACGLQPIGKDGLKSADELAPRLLSALHEIRTVYSKLIARLEDSIATAFDVAVRMPDSRSIIADRASKLAQAVIDPGLKAFAVRLADRMLSDRAWVESVANLLARKSPERWLDTDEVEFHHQLHVAAGRFKRTEIALVGMHKKNNGHACRVSLTKSDGSEVAELVNWDGADENRIRSLEQDISRFLSQHGRHGLAAAMRAIWMHLEKSEKAANS